MQEKLWCRLFGHDFRSLQVEHREGFIYGIEFTAPIDWCRNCGLTKEELRSF